MMKNICRSRGYKWVILLVPLLFVAGAAWAVVATNGDTPEVRTLLLQERLDRATSTTDKAGVLREMAQTGTLPALKIIEGYADGTGTLARRASALSRIMLKAHPEYAGFVSLFNGTDLTGWKGLVENPIARAKMSANELAAAQQKADEQMRKDWKVEDGMIVYVGNGFDNLCTVDQYGDFELYVDWRLDPAGAEPDAGIYLRGTPQVQIWDTARTDVGAEVGSGGLYNNQQHPDKPLCVADRATGEWNNFRIRMEGDRVSVWLNGVLVVDDVVLENYWDRSQPIFPREQLELQAHGSKVYYRNLYVKRLNESQ